MGIVLDYAIGSLLSGAILTLFYFLLSSVLVAAYSIISKGSLSLLFKSSLQILKASAISACLNIVTSLIIIYKFLFDAFNAGNWATNGAPALTKASYFAVSLGFALQKIAMFVIASTIFWAFFAVALAAFFIFRSGPGQKTPKSAGAARLKTRP